jgi:hypothetical protein
MILSVICFLGSYLVRCAAAISLCFSILILLGRNKLFFSSRYDICSFLNYKLKIYNQDAHSTRGQGQNRAPVFAFLRVELEFYFTSCHLLIRRGVYQCKLCINLDFWVQSIFLYLHLLCCSAIVCPVCYRLCWRICLWVLSTFVFQ